MTIEAQNKLIDIAFSCMCAMYQNQEWLASVDQETVMEWARKQFTDCGFEVVPMGSAHARLSPAYRAKHTDELEIKLKKIKDIIDE